jgi:hypothetical protein
MTLESKAFWFFLVLTLLEMGLGTISSLMGSLLGIEIAGFGLGAVIAVILLMIFALMSAAHPISGPEEERATA